MLSSTAVWSNGSQYADCLSKPYSDPAPSSQDPPTASTNQGGTYKFIVTADAPGMGGKTYNIQVNAKYLNTVTLQEVTAYATLKVFLMLGIHADDVCQPEDSRQPVLLDLIQPGERVVLDRSGPEVKLRADDVGEHPASEYRQPCVIAFRKSPTNFQDCANRCST